MNRNVRFVLKNLNLYREEDEFFWRITTQYVTLLIIGFLIASNVQSFMRNLLVSLKNVLKENSVKVSYYTTLLIFSFVSRA